MCRQLLGVVCSPMIHISLYKLHMARHFVWRKANRTFWAFLILSCYALLPKYVLQISFCVYLLDNDENKKIQRDFEIKLYHMSSICIQCIMRSHDRKLDNFLTLLILNIQVQKRKEKAEPIDCHWMVKCPVQVQMKTNLHFPCSDITEAFFLQANWPRQFYILATAALLETLRMTLW